MNDVIKAFDISIINSSILQQYQWLFTLMSEKSSIFLFSRDHFLLKIKDIKKNAEFNIRSDVDSDSYLI